MSSPEQPKGNNIKVAFTHETYPAPAMQQFNSGATRSADSGKNDYNGFLSFQALEAYGNYMTRHQVTADGSKRESDNWKKGIPLLSYVRSMVRHSLELMGLWSGYVSQRLRKEYPLHGRDFLIEETACALFFNVQGFLHEWTKERADLRQSPQEQAVGAALAGVARPTDYLRKLAAAAENPNVFQHPITK